MTHKRGFTLIEVLLALAILAIAVTALIKASAQTINNTSRLKEKSIKHWVAMQAINKIQMQELTLHSSLPSTKPYKVFGQTWYFRAQKSPTGIKNVQKLTITVGNHEHGPFTDPLMGFYYEK